MIFAVSIKHFAETDAATRRHQIKRNVEVFVLLFRKGFQTYDFLRYCYIKVTYSRIGLEEVKEPPLGFVLQNHKYAAVILRKYE